MSITIQRCANLKKQSLLERILLGPAPQEIFVIRPAKTIMRLRRIIRETVRSELKKAKQ